MGMAWRSAAECDGAVGGGRMNPVIIGTLAWLGFGLLIALAVSRFMRHGHGPEPCYVEPELEQAVREALAGYLEELERLAEPDDWMDVADATREDKPGPATPT